MRKPFIATILFLILLDLIFLVIMSCWAVDASAQMGGGPPPPMGYGMMRGEGRPGMMPGPP